MATDNKSDIQPLLVDSNKSKYQKSNRNKTILIVFIVLIVIIGVYLIIAGVTEIWPFEADDEASASITPTRYVISDFYPGGRGNPFSPPLYQSYPLDVCVNIGLSETAINEYGIYSCEGTERVIFTDYGNDETCGDVNNGTIGEIIDYNDTIQQGEFHSFNCEGIDNYVVGLQYIGDDTCCNSPTAAIQTFATGICHEQNPECIASGICRPYSMYVLCNK